MACNYKETTKVDVKGFLNYEDKIIEMEDGEPVRLDEVFTKFNGNKVSLTLQFTNELDK